MPPRQGLPNILKSTPWSAANEFISLCRSSPISQICLITGFARSSFMVAFAAARPMVSPE